MISAHRAQARSFDLIIIGAGPAGASAAVQAARQGLKTALVDKCEFPRDKLCGGALTGRAMSTFRRVFGQALPDVPVETRTTMAFRGFGQDLGRDENAPPLYLGMRRSFDQSLVAAAEACGAEGFFGTTPEVDLRDMTVRLGDSLLKSTILIAADGVNSPVARQIFGRAFDHGKIGFALEVELPNAAPDRELRIDFGAADWGYGWQFPKAEGTTIGLGGLHALNPKMKAALAQYLALLKVTDTPKVKGQFLPFGDFRRVPGQGRVLLAGDAAGLVDPITGEGIGHAMESGALAATAAAQAIATGQLDDALRQYRQALAPIHRGLSQARVLRHLIFRPGLRGVFISNFRRSSHLRSAYLQMMAGNCEYSDLIRLTARRLPRAIVRSLRAKTA